MKSLLPILMLMLAGTAFASGAGHHSHGGGDHMVTMGAVKKKIPAEYRVMDRTPVAPTAASLQSGADLFARNCAVCHGAEGRGDGPAAASLPTPPANFHDAHHRGFYGPGEKYWIISNGLQSGMPPFGERLSSRQRWDLVNHILNLPQENLNALFD
ncbi:cbb3-type cytochrome c oxidase subunit III [Geothermobacter ehrlichii]|uniref:Cbb3-type cytochrome c oxidase subunit III n=1 Tax=Geothermobacter ehrlichii TaxID=213224 RepID=A0A5D3WL66_9BACT|nr:cytochrome c [Geothermobacter ehrlichii]TYO98253.1 cbb3-type cytochrome c oxidase subunit III [Geothermobacter ehrlichii]